MCLFYNMKDLLAFIDTYETLDHKFNMLSFVHSTVKYFLKKVIQPFKIIKYYTCVSLWREEGGGRRFIKSGN